MQTIEIDFDVFKQLTVLRESEVDTYNNVLRRLLKLGAPTPAATAAAGAEDAWVTKGARFPAGTEFRATYKGETYQASIVGGAFVRSDGETFGSLSSAAVAITGNPVNGWRFWECRVPGSAKWVQADTMRS